MGTIGRRAAITQLQNGLVLRGTLGWIAWFALHLVYLVGFGKLNDRLRRLVVALLELDVWSQGHLQLTVRRRSGVTCGDA
jgi:hypothetical protein